MNFLSEKEIELVKTKYSNSEEVLMDLLYLKETYVGFDKVKEWVLSSNNPKYTSKGVQHLANLSYYLYDTTKRNRILENAYRELRRKENTNRLNSWFVPYLQEAYRTGTVESLSK